jgi:hypothetical protein
MESFLQWISIVTPTIVCFVFLLNQIKDIQRKMDRRFEQQEERISQKSRRTDKLYEMFIDLLKEKK